MSTRRERLAELGPISSVMALALALTFVAHLAAGERDYLAILPGLLLIFVTVMLGYTIAKLFPSRLPDLFWVSIVATVAGFPGVPGSEVYIAQLSKLNLVATMTPVLAFAGLGLSERDVELFRSTGLKMVAISLLVFLGTFVGSALVAELTLRLMGV